MHAQTVKAAQAAQPLLSLVVPFFNDDDILPQALEDMLLALNAWGCSFELIVIDDASSDGTILHLQEAKRQFDQQPTHHGSMVLIPQQQNTGQQQALIRAMALAKGTWILTLTSDDGPLIPQLCDVLTHIVKQEASLPELIHIARRGRRIGVWAGALRHLVGWFLQWRLGKKIPDPLSPINFVRRDVFQRIAAKVEPGPFPLIQLLSGTTTHHSLELAAPPRGPSHYRLHRRLALSFQLARGLCRVQTPGPRQRNHDCS